MTSRRKNGGSLPAREFDIIPLSPEDFQNGLLFPRLPKRIGSLHREAHLRDNLLRRVDRYRSAGHNFFLRRADVYRIWPIVGAAEKPRQAALPTTRPKGIGPKAWLVVQEVYELGRDGGKWPDREALLRKVRDRIGHDGLSLRTLDEALAYLRQERLIDR